MLSSVTREPPQAGSVARSRCGRTLWDGAAEFSEVHRVPGPGGRPALTVHRRVLDFAVEELRGDAAAARLTEMSFNQRKRRFYSPAVELIARRNIG
jgi:hypothetical protein